MIWNEVKEVSFEETKMLNPEFNFDGWEISRGEIFKDYKNYYLTSNKEGLFLIIWLDRNGIIISRSKKYADLLLKNRKNVKSLTTQIKNEMCKPIDKSRHLAEVWDIWDARIKNVKEKEKGLKRLLIKEGKLYKENGCYKFNKIDGLVKSSGKIIAKCDICKIINQCKNSDI